MSKWGVFVGFLAVLGTGVLAAPRCSDARCRLPQEGPLYCVGAATRDITPSGSVYLGGYGFGPVRRSTGVGHPISARAMAISKGDTTLVFAAIDTQGHFLAYQGNSTGTINGPYGFADIRSQVSRDRGVPPQNILIASIHTHAGPDDTGIWGGLDNSYLQFIASQTVAAIEAAVDNEAPARLFYAAIDAAPYHLLENLLPPAYPLDTTVRALVALGPRHRDEGEAGQETDDAARNAEDAGQGRAGSSAADEPERAFSGGRVLATLVNFSAHPTVLGSSNTLIAPDWPGATRDRLEAAAPGSTAIVMVSSVGRTQPIPTNTPGSDFAAVETYGGKVASLVLEAEKSKRPVTGPLAVTQRFLEIASTNTLLLGLMVDGTPHVDRILRSILPPYFTAPSRIGTVVGAARIGDVMFAAVPAESYPETELVLKQRVDAAAHFLFALAEDQLGYDPPAYEVPVVKECSPTDEGLFILSPEFGADVTRNLLGMAKELGFAVTDTTYSGVTGGPTPPVFCSPAP